MKAGPPVCGWEEALGTRVCQLLIVGVDRGCGRMGGMQTAQRTGQGRSTPRGRWRCPPRTLCWRELEPRRLQPPPHCQAGGGEAKAACVATQCVQHALAQEASGRRTDSTNTREQSNDVLMPGSGACSLEAARPVPAGSRPRGSSGTWAQWLWLWRD